MQLLAIGYWINGRAKPCDARQRRESAVKRTLTGLGETNIRDREVEK